MRAVRTLGVALLFAAVGMAQVELAPELFDMASRLQCPVCVSETVAQSASDHGRERRSVWRGMMPGFGSSLEGDDVDRLVAFVGTPPRRARAIVARNPAPVCARSVAA